MWKRNYGSSDTLTDLNKICSEFGQNQSGNLKGLFLVDSLDEKEIIITIQNNSSAQVSQGGANILDYSIVSQILEYKPEIVSSEYTNIQISSIENLQTILDDKQNISLNYPISSITGLQTNLDTLTSNININTNNITTNTNNITSNLNILTSLTLSLSSIQTQQDINTNDIVSLNNDNLSNKIFFGIRTTDVVLTSLESVYYSTYDNVVLTNNQIYSQTNDSTITVLKAGVYKIEFCSTFYNGSFNDRVNMGSIVEINDINDRTTGGLSTCYIRHSSYGRHGTTKNSLIFNLNINDRIRVFNGGNKSSAQGFNSELSGLRFVVGSNILITYLS